MGLAAVSTIARPTPRPARPRPWTDGLTHGFQVGIPGALRQWRLLGAAIAGTLLAPQPERAEVEIFTRDNPTRSRRRPDDDDAHFPATPTTGRLLGREIDDLLLRLRGLVLVRDLLAQRGATAAEIDEHAREADRVRARLAALIGGQRGSGGGVTQVVLVTGATDGLGKAVSIELARAGDRPSSCTGAPAIAPRRRWPRSAPPPASDLLRACVGDLASLAQVRSLAESVAATEPRLDALVNNAGIGTVEPGGGARVESADGHELRFAVNYLAPFLLTRLLEPLLLRSAPARIVNVASAGQAPVDFDDVMLERRLRRQPRLQPEQAGDGHDDVRHRRAAGRTGRDGDVPSPGHLHADQDGAGRRPGPARFRSSPASARRYG